MLTIKQFWDNAVSYDQYVKDAEIKLQQAEEQNNSEYATYYALGIRRMQRMLEKYIPDTNQLKQLENKNFSGKILIISEAWCGDASQVIPVIVQFFKNSEIRISYRDQEPSLITDFLTNNTKSIPIVIFLTDDFDIINFWGPRPKFGKKLLIKHQENPADYPKDIFYKDLQLYYSKNKGLDTISELLQLI